MKKVTTTTGRGIGKLRNGQLTIGLDVGDRSSYYCVLNGAGEVILEERVATSPEAMKKTTSERHSGHHAYSDLRPRRTKSDSVSSVIFVNFGI